MKAYYTHNNAYDAVVILETGTAVIIESKSDFLDFIGRSPYFEDWNGKDTKLSPNATLEDVEDKYGDVIAIHDDNDDLGVVVIDKGVWMRRSVFWLGEK